MSISPFDPKYMPPIIPTYNLSVQEFNLMTRNLDELEINRSNDGTECFISERNNKHNIYDKFILSDKIRVKTICEISFWTEEVGSTKFIPRLTFKKIIKKTDEVKETKSDIITISFSSSDDGKNEFWKLISFLKSFKDLIDTGDFDNKYAIVDPEKIIITTKNKAEVIKKIISNGYSDEFWNDLSKSNPDLATKLSYARIQVERKKVLNEFQERLKKYYSETKGDDSWQNWISKNNWLFGVNYKSPIEKAKINLSGIMPDFLYPTIDGFVDILEIKLPKDEVLAEDLSHKGSWKWTSETNGAIGQVVNYLIEIDRLRFENENKVQNETQQKVLFLKPRAFILIGNSENWNDPKKEALRKLNYYLHNIEVITYKDLLDRGNQFINTNILTNP
jgi:hypothetical protein